MGLLLFCPKCADKISQYKPICLLRCIYKLITKTLTLRIEPFAPKLIGKNQNTFMKKRCIVDGIMSLHEILHHSHIKKHVGIVLNLDFEKAFDKVNWNFLINCLKVMAFSDFLC
jgi:hypothetical protein